jgi:hypothetical protein
MSQLMERAVPKKKKPSAVPRDRIDLRGDPEWIRRADFAARSIGLNLSSYIRMVVTQRMEQDGVPKNPPKE